MSMTSPIPDAASLHHRLAALRRRGRAIALARGVSRLVTVVFLWGLVAALCDWRWRLPDLVRAAALVGTLAAAGFVCFRYLYRPLTTPDDDLSLALRIEEAYPGLNDSLASAVEFDAAGETSGESAALRAEAVRRALGRARGVEFERIVSARGVAAGVAAAVSVAAVAAALAWAQPAMAVAALARLADPFGGHAWPRQTRLELEPHPARIGRNEAFEVRARIRGVLPEKAAVVFRFDGQPPQENQCDVVRETPTAGRLATRLDAGRVQRSFRFQVFANDAASDEFEVEVLPPPVLAALDGRASPQVRLWPPRYTNLPSPQDLPAGTGNIEAVVGTRAVLRAAADRPLARAWIEFQPDNRLTPLAGFLAPLGAANGLGVAAAVAVGPGVWEPVDATLDADRRRLTATFVPRLSGLYVLHFEDDAGLHNGRLYELRLRPDPAPTVRLDRPSPSRDVLTVLPGAELPLHLVAEDPVFALRSVDLEYRTRREDVPRRLPLYDHSTTIAATVAPAAGAGMLAARWHLRPTRLQFRRSLALRSLTHPDGSPLREGDAVILRARADDFDDVTVPKEPGRSHEVEVRIVGRDDLELVLSQKQAELRQELLRLREKQRDALDKVRQSEARLRRGAGPTAEDLDRLLQAQQVQQQIRERIGEAEEGLRGEARQLLETLRLNRVRGSAVRERASDVARELDRLADEELPPIEPRLGAARRQAERSSESARAFRRAQAEEQAVAMERRAAAVEQEARLADDEAAVAGRRAAGAKDAAERERHQAETDRQRDRAKDLREQARELRRQAARVRREAVDGASRETVGAAAGGAAAALAERRGQPRPDAQLAEARRHQEEVEKTLSDLLNRMEPWNSTRELKADAGRVLQDQRQLQAAVEELRGRLPARDPAELEPAERAELNDLRAAQQRLEERAGQLLDRMDRLAKKRKAEGDDETAAELETALQGARDGDLAGHLKAAREHTAANRLAQAARSQDAAARELQSLVKSLEDRREAELDRLARRLRDAERQLDELTEQQEQLRKKAREAAAKGDSEELKRLARRQDELRRKAEELAEELTRLRAGRSAQAAAEAAAEMAESGRRLARGEPPPDEEDVLDRLDEAREQARQARERTDEELQREQMARAADALRRLRDRQKALNDEAARIQAEVLTLARKQEAKAEFKWPRQLRLGSWHRLQENQDGLAEETETLADKQLAAAPVLRRSVKKAAETMHAAAERVQAVKLSPPPPEKTPDAETRRLQELALRRLDQVLTAIKPDEAGPTQFARGGAGEPTGDDGGAPGDDLPPQAQLRLLRALQLDVNRRTEAIRKQYPDGTELGEGAKAELEAIRRDQTEVAELLEAFTRPADEPTSEKRETK